MLHNSGHMDARDYQTYRELFTNMSNFMRRPNLIVHLDLSPEESERRIKVTSAAPTCTFERSPEVFLQLSLSDVPVQMRSRDVESGIPLAYLQVDA